MHDFAGGEVGRGKLGWGVSSSLIVSECAVDCRCAPGCPTRHLWVLTRLSLVSMRLARSPVATRVLARFPGAWGGPARSRVQSCVPAGSPRVSLGRIDLGSCCMFGGVPLAGSEGVPVLRLACLGRFCLRV